MVPVSLDRTEPLASLEQQDLRELPDSQEQLEEQEVLELPVLLDQRVLLVQVDRLVTRDPEAALVRREPKDRLDSLVKWVCREVQEILAPLDSWGLKVLRDK